MQSTSDEGRTGHSHDHISPSSHSLGRISVSPHDDISSQITAPTGFVQDLLEGVLSGATSRPPLCHSRDGHRLSNPTKNHVSYPAHSMKEEEDDANVLTRKKSSQTASPSASSSTSETDSSDSESENDSTMLTLPLAEFDAEADRDLPLRTKNEQDTGKIYIPRPDVVITEQHTLVKAGTISAVLDNAIVVTTFNLTETPKQLSDADINNATALDTGSLLCFSDGTVLGAVFETFGPVSSPLYVVRFNDSDEIPAIARVGVEVKYVEQELRLVRGRDVRGKGYDTSGRDDEEADAEEFSDDEMERRARKKKRSSSAGPRIGPQKRVRGYVDRRGHERNDHGTRQQGGHDRERQYYQQHRVERMWDTRPVEHPRPTNLREYNLGPFLDYRNEISSQLQPHAVTPQSNFLSGTFNNPSRSDAIMPYYHPPLGMPSPLMNPAGGPGPALNPMLTAGSYRSQLSPAPLLQATPPYGTLPTPSRQPHFARPEESWSSQVNFHVTGHNLPGTSTYQQRNMAQAQTGRAPRMEPSQIHHLQRPKVWKSDMEHRGSSRQ